MTQDEIRSTITRQREFFASGATLDYEYRANALSALYEAVRSHEGEIAAALREDLGKGEAESYMCETGLLLSDIRWLRRHLRSLMRPKRTRVGLAQFPGHGELRRIPYGVTLIMSPWNYPLLLSLEPLAAAVAAGNTAVIKPSAYSSATSGLIAEMLGEIFPPDYVAVVTGGREENSALLEQKWDKIFFTGGAAVGREVLRAAAERLTPAALELGGKSPAIVDASARLSARCCGAAASAAAASTTRSCISPARPCRSAAWARAAWAPTTGAGATRSSPTWRACSTAAAAASLRCATAPSRRPSFRLSERYCVKAPDILHKYVPASLAKLYDKRT